jgi:hypothetical protein
VSLLSTIYGTDEVRLAADMRTNSVVISGTSKTVSGLQAFLDRLDGSERPRSEGARPRRQEPVENESTRP